MRIFTDVKWIAECSTCYSVTEKSEEKIEERRVKKETIQLFAATLSVTPCLSVQFPFQMNVVKCSMGGLSRRQGLLRVLKLIKERGAENE